MTKTTDKQQITRFAGQMTAATALSRLTGLARDILKARYFGTGLAADAFTVAFRLPNLLRRLFGEGTLSAAFIPVYTEYRRQLSQKESWQLVSAVFCLLTTILALIAILGITFAEPLVQLFAPGFKLVPGKFELTVQLTRWMFPYILFVGLAALAMAVLNTHKRFFLPALAPVMLNLSLILAMLFLCPVLGRDPVSQIYGLAFGVLVGGIGQFMIQLPALKQLGLKFNIHFGWQHQGVRQIMKLMGPGIFALGVTQINILVDTFLASMLEEGSVAALEYANRLIQLPLGLFAISITTAILPKLSEQAGSDDLSGLKSTLSYALRMIFFIMIPATAGLIVLRQPIVALVFQRGQFDLHSTHLTGLALTFYSLGLFAYGGLKAVGQVFYARKDTVTPVKVASLAMTCNIILNFLLVGPLKLGGLALATSLAAMINMGLLILLLRQRIGPLDGRKILFSFIKILILSLLMAAAVHFTLNQLNNWALFSGLPQKMLLTFGGIGVGCLSFAVLAHFFKLEEMNWLLEFIHRRSNLNNL